MLSMFFDILTSKFHLRAVIEAERQFYKLSRHSSFCKQAVKLVCLLRLAINAQCTHMNQAATVQLSMFHIFALHDTQTFNCLLRHISISLVCLDISLSTGLELQFLL